MVTIVLDGERAPRMGLSVVRPGTALVVCARRTGEVRAVRTSGRVMAWPWLHTLTELALTPFTVLARASGEGAALTADGQRVDVTLRLRLRPRRDDAVVLGIARAFGVPPRELERATRLVEALTPALATLLAQVPLAGLRPFTALGLSGHAALGFELESVEVLHMGEALPDPAGGYRGGAPDVHAVRFEGQLVTPPAAPLQATPPLPPQRAQRERPPPLTWAEADTSQRVILGWFILLGGLPVAALMATARQSGHGWLVAALFLLALCGLANVLFHLRSWWAAPPAILSVVSCVSVSNVLARPLGSVTNPGAPTFSSIVGFLLAMCGLWFAVVVMFASNPKARGRPS